MLVLGHLARRPPRPFGAAGGFVRSAALGVVVTATVALVGCAGAERDVNDPSRPLAPYGGRSAELFDDRIEPAAVGLDLDHDFAPRTDRALRERAQVGDAVLRVRVSTVTAKTDGPDAVYQLGLHTVEKLAGKAPPPTDFTVQITKRSEAHGIMKNFESRLVGYAFVAFVRQFAQPDGEREVHFHLTPDTKEVKAAVDDAVALGELR
jgi:hypothetical protein